MANHTELSAWQRLTSVATIGLQRSPLVNDSLWPDASLGVADTSNERTLLRAAAATYLWQIAGARAAIQSPAVESTTTPPAPQDSIISEKGVWRLARMINGDCAELIPEWFALAATSGKVVPAHWLPVVLDRVPSSLTSRYATVLGSAATWLAECNPKWTIRPEVNEPALHRWSDGTFEERRAELTAARRSDPALARTWLQTTWGTEAPEAREAFLAIMLVNVSPQDEPFLESILDDKRKSVRLAAAECLSRLPQSAHAQRNLARLQSLLTLDEQKGGLLGKFRKRKVEVQLPAELDKAALRDGVEAKPPAQRKIGERAFWLMQMMSMVEPAHWCRAFQCDADTFIQAAMASEYAADLLSALTEAAARHPDSAWVAALCDVWIEAKDAPHVVAQALTTLITAAPTTDRVALFKSVVSQAIDRNSNATFSLIGAVDVPWSVELTKLVMTYLSSVVRSDKQQWSYARNTLTTWSSRCEVVTALTVLSDLLANGNQQSPWHNAIENMNEVVAFRAAMRQELLT